MTLGARLYITGEILIGFGLAGAVLLIPNPIPIDWTIFVILVLLATGSQWIPLENPAKKYHPSQMFYFTGALLLPPQGFVALVLLSHLVEWAREALARSRRLAGWYVQPFNISMHLVTGLLAGWIFNLLVPDSTDLLSTWAVVGGLIGAAVYTLVNHALVGLAHHLVQAESWRSNGAWDVENLGLDFTLLVMGYLIAVLLQVNPWLILPALAPLYLLQRSLVIPWLKQQVNRDDKTGLWNGAYFLQALGVEHSRANRYQRPLTIVMADLDFLRDINNAYGHLAGDAVIIGAAQILRNHFRDYDVVARFGGEEFAILMPEASPQEAFARVEVIRQTIEQVEFEAPTTQIKIKATMSFGIAGNNGGRFAPEVLVHRADVAAYVAKVEGRNQTRIYQEDMAGALGRVEPG
jgi:diguanylate cyclase (GGDEF)-like protein